MAHVPPMKAISITFSLLFILFCLPHQITSSLRAGLVHSAYLSNLEPGRESTERSLVKY